MDNAILAGGAQYGDERVHKDANGHLYVQAGPITLIIDGNIVIQNYGSGGTYGLTLSTNPVADPVPSNTIVGDLTPNPSARAYINDWKGQPVYYKTKGVKSQYCSVSCFCVTLRPSSFRGEPWREPKRYWEQGHV